MYYEYLNFEIFIYQFTDSPEYTQSATGGDQHVGAIHRECEQ